VVVYIVASHYRDVIFYKIAWRYLTVSVLHYCLLFHIIAWRYFTVSVLHYCLTVPYS